MKQITHTNELVDAYEFSKADFERHDIDDQGAVKFNAANKKTAEVSDAAAAFILENHPEFAEVVAEKDANASDADVALADMSRSALQDAAASRNLDTSGSKTELVARIEEHDAALAAAVQ